jgi:hypothetical protein
MLPIALMTLFGVGLIATFVGLEDDDPVPAKDAPDTDDGAETPPETQITPLVELLPADGPAETFEAEDLERVTTWEERLLVVGGPEAETITIDPETTEDLYLNLTSGGEDVVIAPVGQDVDALDPEEDGTPDSPDHITLLFGGELPGEVERQDEVVDENGFTLDWVSDYDNQASTLDLDASDTLHIETPEDLGGSLLPIYQKFEYIPAASNNSFGLHHQLYLYHVPEGVTPDLEAYTSYYGDCADDECGYGNLALIEGLTPIATLSLGNEGAIADLSAWDRGDDSEVTVERWNNVRALPTITSTLPILPQHEPERYY